MVLTEAEAIIRALRLREICGENKAILTPADRWHCSTLGITSSPASAEHPEIAKIVHTDTSVIFGVFVTETCWSSVVSSRFRAHATCLGTSSGTIYPEI